MNIYGRIQKGDLCLRVEIFRKGLRNKIIIFF